MDWAISSEVSNRETFNDQRNHYGSIVGLQVQNGKPKQEGHTNVMIWSNLYRDIQSHNASH